MSPGFVQRGGHWCRRVLVGRTTFWIFFFFLWFAKVRVWYLQLVSLLVWLRTYQRRGTCCHLLGGFRMASRNHFLRQYHPLTATCAVSLPLFKIRTKLNTVLPTGAFSPQSVDNWRWISDASMPSFLRIHLVRLCHDNRLHFATPVHELRPLDLVMTQQFFTGMTDQGHLVVECCTTTALSDLTTCFLPKQQLMSKSFPNALLIGSFKAQR